MKKRNQITPLKAIRLKCIDCSGYSKVEVRNCVIPECPLYQFRFGKNPNRKGKGNKSPISNLSRVKK